MTKSRLTNLYLNQELQNSSKSQSSNYLRLRAEKPAVICWKLYWNRTFNMYRWRECVRKTSATYTFFLLHGQEGGGEEKMYWAEQKFSEKNSNS